MSEINGDTPNPDIERGLDSLGAPRATAPTVSVPLYREIAPRIPVSRDLGKVWKVRKEEGERRKKPLIDAWDEALAYYNYMQSTGEGTDRIQSARLRRKSTGKTIDDRIHESENHVYINVSATAPTLYMRNPDVSIRDTAQTGNTDVAEACEELVRVLFNRRHSPGIGLLGKMRKSIVQTQLRNSAYLLTGYNHVDGSLEELQRQLRELEEKWAQAKDKRELLEIEGQMNAMQEQISFAEPTGPWLRAISAKNVIVDDESEEDDHSDARWMMYSTMMRTATLLARFGNKEDSDGVVSYKSLFQPTHVLKPGDGDTSDNGSPFDGENLTMLAGKDDHAAHGFNDAETFRHAQFTKVWYIFDKTTRRVLLFNDRDWSWPLFVWDDLHKLPGFYSMHRLFFYVHPDKPECVGEVSYYLDQQDTINEILSEQSRMRSWARKNVFYDSNTIESEDVAAVLGGPTNTARGINVPEGRSLEEVLPRSVPPPSIQFPELFDPESRRISISRVAGTDPAFRGEQYRTNTTNRAVNRYEEAATVRSEMRTDRIEEVVARIAHDLVYMCAQHMTPEQLQVLIGERAQYFPTNILPQDLDRQYSFEITVGSTQKPNSRIKKQEAIEVGQMLGQFGDAAPIALKIALDVMSRAFDDIIISDEDWKLVTDFIDGQLAPEGGGSEALAQAAQQVDSLPPEAKRALGEILSKGVPLEQALPEVLQLAQAQPPTGQPTQ